MALDVVTLALAKKFTEDTAIGLGAVKGKPCTVESVEKVEGGTEITLKWTGDDGTVQRRKFTVADGISIDDIKLVDGHLICYLTDGREIDAGELKTGVQSGIWIGTTRPPSDDYVLWIDPTDTDPGFDTATSDDIESLWA